MHIPGEGVGKGAAVDVCHPMQLGLSPVHRYFKYDEMVKGTCKRDHSAVCDQLPGVFGAFVGYGLVL